MIKERKQTTAGLILLVEETKELVRMMGGTEPKILVGGRKRFCRVWREETDTPICDRCLQVGHTLPECKLAARCRWCGRNHMSGEHKCRSVDCAAPKGTACQHCRKHCYICEKGEHFSGFRQCEGLTSRIPTPRFGPATLIVADNTAVNGISDRS